MTDKNKRYATVKHPTVAAAVEGLYRFADTEQARKRLDELRAHFVISRKFEKEADEHKTEGGKDNRLVIWIKGYGVTPEEEKRGFLGHYAVIAVRPAGEGKYRLLAHKLPIPLPSHPQKKRFPQRHPNWGHPVLRSVKKGKLYKNIDEAQAALSKLHEEFPEVTIPNTGKLFLMTYGKREAGGPPVQKIVLEIKLRPDASCTIEWRENAKRKGPPLSPDAKDAGIESGDQKGYFASMVTLKKKKPRALPLIAPQGEAENS